MEPLVGLFAFAIIILFFGGPYFYASYVGRKKSREIEGLRQELHTLSARFYKLDATLQDLQKRGVTSPAESAKEEPAATVQVNVEKPAEQQKPVAQPAVRLLRLQHQL